MYYYTMRDPKTNEIRSVEIKSHPSNSPNFKLCQSPQEEEEASLFLIEFENNLSPYMEEQSLVSRIEALETAIKSLTK